MATSAAINFKCSSGKHIVSIVQRTDATPANVVEAFRKFCQLQQTVDIKRKGRLNWDYMLAQIVRYFTNEYFNQSRIKIIGEAPKKEDSSYLYDINIIPIADLYSNYMVYDLEGCFDIEIYYSSGEIIYKGNILNFS